MLLFPPSPFCGQEAPSCCSSTFPAAETFDLFYLPSCFSVTRAMEIFLLVAEVYTAVTLSV